MTLLLKNAFSENYYMPKQTKIFSLILKASFFCQSSLYSCAFTSSCLSSAVSPIYFFFFFETPSEIFSVCWYLSIHGAAEFAGGLSVWDEGDGMIISFKQNRFKKK